MKTKTSSNIDESLFCRSSRLVCAPNLQGKTYNIHLLFRVEFNIDETPDFAVLRFYGSSLTEIALNGKAFHQGPCRSCPPVLYYDEIEMNSLVEGKYVLVFHQVVELLNEEAGIVCELELQNNGRTSYLLQNPKDYEVCLPDCYLINVPKNSGTGYAEYMTMQEYDILSPDYQDNFQPAIYSKKLCQKEWWNPRPIPLFHENVVRPTNCAKEATGTVLLDFSTMVFGRPELNGTGKGEIRIEYIEDLNGGWISPKGTCVMYDDKIMDAYGEFHWKCFRKRSFRYVRLHNVEFKNLDFRVNEYNYPVKEIGSFHSSDTFLNRLVKISIDTLKVCMDDFYNDCPHRDQNQWMDAFATSQIALGLFGVTDLTRKCIIQYALCSLKNGKVVSPSITGSRCFVDYVLMLYRYVQWYVHITNDTELVQEVYPILKEVLVDFYRHEDDEHFLDYQLGKMGIVFLENTFELKKKGKSTALQAMYYGALQSMAALASMQGLTNDAQEFSHRAVACRQVLLKTCSHKTQSYCFQDHANHSEHTYCMINFSCELGHWTGSCGVLEFVMEMSEPQQLMLSYAAYAQVRLYVNDKLKLTDDRIVSWRDQPMYEPRQIAVNLRKGTNHVRFEVKSNELNWELFFCFDNGFFPPLGTISECDWQTRELIIDPREVPLRKWTPPLFSQSTQAYCGFSGIPESEASIQAMLRQSLRNSYPRTYLSVRVPYFCTEEPDACEDSQWVLPVNSPWSAFVLLTALFENGCESEGLQVIRDYWKQMVDAGAVNTWEEWGSNSSLCHAWGAVPAYFMQRKILGVHHDSWHLGYILVRPQLFDLDFAEGYVALINSENIYIKLEREDSKTRLTIVSPETVKIKLDTSLLVNCIIDNNSRLHRKPESEERQIAPLQNCL